MKIRFIRLSNTIYSHGRNSRCQNHTLEPDEPNIIAVVGWLASVSSVCDVVYGSFFR